MRKTLVSSVALALTLLVSTIASAAPSLLADDQAMLDAANKKGITVPDSIIDERVAIVIHKEFKDDHSAFVNAIQAKGYTEASFRTAEREHILVQAMRYQMKKEAAATTTQADVVPK